MINCEDLEIITRIRDGNIDAFEKVFNLYYEELTVFAYKYLYDMSECQDLVQNLFFYLWENRTQINVTKSLKGYLYKSVKNRSLDYLREKRIYDSIDLLSINAIVSSEDVDLPEAHILGNRIMEIVKTLPSQMSSVFIKKSLEGYTIKEISKELNISANTVKTHLQRARNTIRKILKESI